MALSVIRFDLRGPGMEPGERARLYSEAMTMAAWADTRGFDNCVLSEHHGSPDGYLPSPLVMAAAIVARTERIPITVAALLVPLHDPIRLAEDLAVLDLLSKGRVSIVAGLGYRPIEYEMMGKAWDGRGKLLDECLDTLVKAWTGEPFEHNGTTVQVTPKPYSSPHPMVLVGGTGSKAATRAARHGFGFFPSVGSDELAKLYLAECKRFGTTPGFVTLPNGPGTLFVADDPDKGWAEIGPYMLHDATTYSSWQRGDVRSHVHSHAQSVDELRAEGIYQILTPAECVELGTQLGPLGILTHHPMCGGTPPELAWPSLELFVDKVMPALD